MIKSEFKLRDSIKALPQSTSSWHTSLQDSIPLPGVYLSETHKAVMSAARVRGLRSESALEKCTNAAEVRRKICRQQLKARRREYLQALRRKRATNCIDTSMPSYFLSDAALEEEEGHEMAYSCAGEGLRCGATYGIPQTHRTYLTDIVWNEKWGWERGDNISYGGDDSAKWLCEEDRRGKFDQRNAAEFVGVSKKNSDDGACSVDHFDTEEDFHDIYTFDEEALIEEQGELEALALAEEAIQRDEEMLEWCVANLYGESGRPQLKLFQEAKRYAEEEMRGVCCPVCENDMLALSDDSSISCPSCCLWLGADPLLSMSTLQDCLKRSRQEHIDGGCKCRPKFHVDDTFGSCHLWITCDGCDMYNVYL